METDILGSGYLRRTIDLGRDEEGPVIATLVSRPAARSTGRAVLYVHGWADYFFQTHLADYYVERGIHFYALDLRKYGRSLLPHQTANFVRDLREYFPELDEAAKIIKGEDGHERLLVNGHSAGGLITSLWAHHVRSTGLVDAIFLNSPFFEFNVPWITRQTVGPMFGAISKVWPYAALRRQLSMAYGHSIHADHYGEWRFDETWKPLGGLPVRAAWLTAFREGQAWLRRGLDIRVPVLVACSTRSYRKQIWSEAAMTADAVLDVEHIAAYAGRLGRHITLVRVDGGMHDLVLSAEPVRQKLFDELDRWMRAYLPE